MGSRDQENEFDPYHKWLGIPPGDGPVDHYRLLGLELFEPDRDVIASAADRQMAHLRTFQAGKYSKLAQQLLNEVSVARVSLLDKSRRKRYDAKLRQAQEAAATKSEPTETRLEPQRKAKPRESQPTPSPAKEVQPERPRISNSALRRPKRHKLLFKTFLLAVLIVIVSVLGAGAYSLIADDGQLKSLLARLDPNKDQPQERAAPTPDANDNQPTQGPPYTMPSGDLGDLLEKATQEATQQVSEEPPKAAHEEAPEEPTQEPSRPGFVTPPFEQHRPPGERRNPGDPQYTMPSGDLSDLLDGASAKEHRPAISFATTDDSKVATCSLPSLDSGRETAVPLTRLSNDGDPWELKLAAFGARRDSPKLRLFPESDATRWRIADEASPDRAIARLGQVDGDLQFLWADAATEEIAERLRWSLLEVASSQGVALLRFNAPQVIAPITTDLGNAENRTNLRLPILYPADALRMDIASIEGLPSFDEPSRVPTGLKEGESYSARLLAHQHVSMHCLFKASGKQLSAEIAFKYQVPTGRDYGLTIRRVQPRIARCEQTLSDIAAAKKAVPGMQRQVRRLSANAANASRRAALNQQIAAAQNLIAGEGAARQELTFLNQLVTIGEKLHNQGTVTCRFYVLHNNIKVPLSVTDASDL